MICSLEYLTLKKTIKKVNFDIIYLYKIFAAKYLVSIKIYVEIQIK